MVLLLLSLAGSLNAAIGKRYTFHVGDKVDMKLFAVHDSVWSDTGRDNNNNLVPRIYLQRKFSITALEVNRLTHAKVEVVIEHLTVPPTGTNIDWPTSTRDVFMIGDGHVLAVISDSMDFVADPTEGFGFLHEVSTFAVPISRSQNAVFLEIGTYPDEGGDEKLRAFAYCDRSMFSELHGPLSEGEGRTEFPNGTSPSLRARKHSVWPMTPKNRNPYAIIRHVDEGGYCYAMPLIPDLRYCAYKVPDTCNGIFPVDGLVTVGPEGRRDTIGITLFESPANTAKSRRFVLHKSDKVVLIRIRPAAPDGSTPLDDQDFLYLRINENTEGWVAEDDFTWIGIHD